MRDLRKSSPTLLLLKTHLHPFASILIVGEFNATTSLILNNLTDSFGHHLEDLIFSFNLTIHNNSQTTFHRQNCFEIFDFFLSSFHLNHLISNFQVLPDDSLSDHLYLYVAFVLNPSSSKLPFRISCDFDTVRIIINSLPFFPFPTPHFS